MPVSGSELSDGGDDAGPRTEGSKPKNWKPWPPFWSQGFGTMLTGTGTNRRECGSASGLSPAASL